jgi:hypothetical protein
MFANTPNANAQTLIEKRDNYNSTIKKSRHNNLLQEKRQKNLIENEYRIVKNL